jgi:hypothetical protein
LPAVRLCTIERALRSYRRIQRFKPFAFLAAQPTTYFFTEISFAAMIAPSPVVGDESESLNPFKLVEAGD